MSKPNNRGSLIGLKYNLPSIPHSAPVAVTAEMEQKILPADVKMSLPPSVSTDGAAVAFSPSYRLPPALPNRRKEPTVLMNAKLPARLHARLKRTAQFNDLSMTDILIRAIEAELATGQYAAPPENWGSDEFNP
jgi:hypothetical protein